MPDRNAEQDPLEAMAADVIDRLRTGRPVNVERYVERWPDAADDIREIFPTIVAMEQLKHRQERTPAGKASLGPDRIERLGDFHIVREIGRGGMGIVYEAMQESLGRRVALKVLPRQALLNDADLHRFLRESRIAAGLHHTNIVPVFGVGEEDGYHYYVMQFIPGIGLDRLVTRMALIEKDGDAAPPDPLADAIIRRLLEMHVDEPITAEALRTDRYWHVVATLGERLADALFYAHEQRALHRDIKPANILIDHHGAVWLTDFGLAKSADTETVTHTGGITGTLRYVAPERLEGHTDARSDIYSLGLTLYELLTRNHAFTERNDTALISSITTGEPPHPRAINAAVPRDIETIILKAIARDPKHRYQKAAALRDDFQNFREGLPLVARRANRAERLWRWCKRKPAIAALSGAVAALVLVTSVVSTVAYFRTRAALSGEARQRMAAEANADLAIEALDRIFDRYTPGSLSPSETLPAESGISSELAAPARLALSNEAAAMLEDLLVFYERLATQTPDSLRARAKSAQARRRTGDIHRYLGDYKQALGDYTKAVEIYSTLLDARPEATALDLARGHIALGRLAQTTNNNDGVTMAYNSALSALNRLPEDKANAPEALFERARAHLLRSVPSGSSPATGARIRPQDPGTEPQQAQGRTSGSANDVEMAIYLLEKLHDADPPNPRYRHLLGMALSSRSMLSVSSINERRRQARERAVQMLEELVEDFPTVPEYRHDLCATLTRVDVKGPHGKTEWARRQVRQAQQLAEGLVKSHPSIPAYRFTLAQTNNHLGLMTDDPDEAVKYLKRAAEIQGDLAERFPGVIYYHAWLAINTEEFTRLLLEQKRAKEAITALTPVISKLETLREGNDSVWYLDGLLGHLYERLATALRQTGDTNAAASAAETSQRYDERMRSARPMAGPRMAQ